MRLETDAIGLTALILVVLAYVWFGCVFLFRRRPPANRRSQAPSRGYFRDCAAGRELRASVESTAPAIVPHLHPHRGTAVARNVWRSVR
jgi:hypothetical protein